MLSPYDRKTENTRSRIIGDRSPLIPNAYYKSAEGNFWFYVNNRGYIHIIRPSRRIYNGKIQWYEINDSILTKEDTVKECKVYGHFKTLEETLKEIKNNT